MKTTEAILATLKDFQRNTVDYVFSRMWDEGDPVDRFLVADEVGLGKTMVAKGVIAKTVDLMHARGQRNINIVYISSNAQIAHQNISRLMLWAQMTCNMLTVSLFSPWPCHR